LVAILLATVLYTGLVLGQNVRTWTGEVPVDGIRLPAGATLISDLEPVTIIRYRAPLDVGVISPDRFRATVDLSRVEATPGGPPTPVPVTVIALDQRIQIVDYQPRTQEVQLDPIEVRQMPVTVTLGTVPEGLFIGPPQTEPSSVTVRGASSRVDSVSAVVARVAIDESALNVDREVELVAVDANGNQVPNVELDPERARVRIAVARQLANVTLPVVPQLVGEPAAGYRITSVTVEPLVITASGEEATITQLENAPTEPIDVTGRTSDLETMVALALPDDVTVSGSDQVRVVLTIEPVEGSQTFSVGVVLQGTQTDQIYGLATPSVSVTLGGAAAALAAFDAATFTATADVSGLGPGEHSVPVTVVPPPELEVLATTPTEVVLTITAVPPSPTPSPSPSATP
jgi:YbbR domain-containing protein